MRLAARLFGFILIVLAITPAARGDETKVREIIARFATATDYSEIERVIDDLGALGDPLAALSLNALNDGNLVVRKDDSAVLVSESRGGKAVLADPVTGEFVADAVGVAVDKVKIKNSIRRKIAAVVSGLTLMANDPAVRMAAAEQIFAKPDRGQLEALEMAIAAEKDPTVRTRMEEARAAILLATSVDEAERVDAISVIAARGDRAALALLSTFSGDAEGATAEALAKAIDAINSNLAWWDVGQNVWYGMSLGSVLLLAAIGLAITFGVMGVINMAHGEMVMLGAYTTFVVQELFRTHAPQYLDHAFAVALAAAFVVAGGVGFALERTVIRFLYGRPLETLLATWGVSLVLQQTVRTIFGPTNREVGNPSWMTGAFQIGEITVTWNRLWIVLFALAVFAALLVAVNFTRMGLQMRAVTQNRRMAGAMGIATPRIDSLTFALGSAIAGIAGVALSQIDNVSPNLGQGYIIDSFMVVVFGGVGNLWGTLIGAITLGVANKFLEPLAGAVFAKIIVLALIILFIQRRPRGLFALRGRAVES